MKLLFTLIAPVSVGILILAGMLIFGGPSAPPAMGSINSPFKSVDWSDLPPLQRYRAADGASLAYRHYAAKQAAPKGSVVLVHGSSARSDSMLILMRAFARAGYDAYGLDIRGHGGSGTKGKIDYVGQLEDDLADFLKGVALSGPVTLGGFSSGGGFVLRFAGSARQDLFSNYLLLSPFISQEAASYRPDSGGWVRVGVPRIIALSILNGFGVTAFNGLTVTSFALDEESKEFLTPGYAFALAVNFRPESDYMANIRAVKRPVSVVAGDADEAFFTDKFAGIFEEAGQDWPVTLLPGVGHIPLTLEAEPVAAAVAAVEAMNNE